MKAMTASSGSGIILRAQSTNEIVVPIRTSDGELQVSSAASQTSGAVSSLGIHAQAARQWEAVAEMLVQLVSHVRVDDDIFDEVLELLAGSRLLSGGGKDQDRYRQALDAINADAVWLALYRRGLVEDMTAPVYGEVRFLQMDAAGVGLAGEASTIS